MFAQMKRKRSVTPLPPCPCGNVCRCHQPPKDDGLGALCLAIFAIVFLFGGAIFLAIRADNNPPPVRHIQVKGQDCIVKYVEDSCTSTGACSGHEEAVCQ